MLEPPRRIRDESGAIVITVAMLLIVIAGPAVLRIAQVFGLGG